MENTNSSVDIISNLDEKVEYLIARLLKIKDEPRVLSTAECVEALEVELQQTANELTDTITGLKIQAQLDTEDNKASEQELVRSQPARMKNMGKRTVKIRFLGGTVIPIKATYYHRKVTLKKHHGLRGFYPGLLLLGCAEGYSAGLSSRIGLLATASSSFAEAGELLGEMVGFKPNVKTISRIVKQLAATARAAVELDSFVPPDDFSGRTVAASTDGGRIRIRKNKRGRKTQKGRTRYSTDWREPKLIIIYVIGEDGKKARKSLPLMDATLNGPDETFALLAYYLKKLQVNKADILLFLSDGAKWIWERAKALVTTIGIATENCLFALDYYHAVEHLSDLASAKRWDKKRKERWINRQKKRLLNGKLDAFMTEIELVCKGSKNTKVKRERNYFKNHLPHMKYAELKAQGLPIGSGAVESGIRRVVNLRLKGPGIFWHEDSADAMLMLRSFYKAGRWNTLKNMAYSGSLLSL